MMNSKILKRAIRCDHYQMLNGRDSIMNCLPLQAPRGGASLGPRLLAKGSFLAFAPARGKGEDIALEFYNA
jgi:hypothetical protein